MFTLIQSLRIKVIYITNIPRHEYYRLHVASDVHYTRKDIFVILYAFLNRTYTFFNAIANLLIDIFPVFESSFKDRFANAIF